MSRLHNTFPALACPPHQWLNWGDGTRMCQRCQRVEYPGGGWSMPAPRLLALDRSKVHAHPVGELGCATLSPQAGQAERNPSPATLRALLRRFGDWLVPLGYEDRDGFHYGRPPTLANGKDAR